MAIIFPIYVIFGLLPPLVWLFYYLRKDLHPESKKMIVNIFFWGAVATVPALAVELGLLELLRYFYPGDVFYGIIKWFLIVALTEEFFKFLVVKWMVLKSPEFDEPMDAMIYMVVAALGFAAAENTLYLVMPALAQPASLAIPFGYMVANTAVVAAGRFLGANFLHTLCSAIIGYFMALSFCKTKSRIRMLVLGFLMAVLLHGLFNFSIMAVGESLAAFAAPAVILTAMSMFVMEKFKKVKNIKSLCNYK